LNSGYFTGAVKNSGGGPLSIINVSGSTALMGANSYTGSNVVRAGSLGINIPAGTTTGGLVLVADNATLTLHKTTPGSSLKAAGATFGTSTSGATTLNLDLANYGNPSAPIINATNGTGVLSVNGTLTLNFNNPANMSAGQFPIIKYTSLTGTGALAFNPIPGITAQLVTNTANKSIDLKITGAPITTWNGSVTNNLWDIQTTTNWTYSGSPVQYSDGSAVYFDDTAPTNNVNLTTALTPGSVLVNTANTYTFGGSGPLYGGTVTKNGSGTLIMDVSGNGYSSTTIAGGTLQVGNNDGLGDLGSGNVDDEGTLVFNQNIALTVAGVISGAGQVVQNDTNIVTLSSANTYTGGTAVNAGVLKMGNAAALGAPGPGTALATIASGSTLDIGGQNIVVTNTIIVHGTGFSATQGQVMSSGGTCIGCGNVGINDLQLLGDATIGGSSGDWTIGANGLGICGNNHVLTKIGSSTVYLQATAVTSPSMVVIAQGGILQFSYPGFGTSVVVLTNNSSVDTWDAAHWTGITSANSFIVANNGGQINNTHGAWYGQADKDVYNGSVTLNGNLTINCTSTYNGMPNGQTYGQQTFNGAVSGVGGITATIATGDTVSFTRANTYSGATIVTGGAYGGTLKLSAIQQGGGAYTNNDGAILDVPRQTGYATVPMSSLALGSTNGSTLSLTRQTALTATAPITATNLTLTGINAVTLPGSAFAVSGQYPLIKYGTLTGGGSLMVGGAVRGVPGYISNNVANSSIDLVVPGGTPVVWTGSSSAIWDIAATLNWQTNSVATDYEQAGSVGDAVTFNDSSSVTNVNISASVSPALIIVNNTNKNYTLTGAIITGNTSLLKQGPGSLLLTNGANTFTGGATINGGTVQLGNAGSLNNASGSVTVTGNGALDFNNQQPTVLACTISGAGLKGLGTLVQNSGANNTYGPGSITLAGSATIGGTNRWDLRNGANTFNTPTNAYTLTKVGAGYTAFSGTAMSTNLGDIYILGGTLGYQAGTTGLGNPTNTIYIGSGGSLEFYSASVPLNKFIVMSNTASLVPDNGAGTSGTTPATVNIISGPIYLAGGNANLNCNYYNGCALSNTISGPGGLTTGYNGYNRFYAPNTYVGDTTVQGGIYLFANSCIVSTNNIYINVGPLFVTNNAYVGVSSTYLNVNLGGLILGQNGSANFATMQIGGSGYVDASGRTDGTFTLPNHSLLRPYNGGYVKGNLVVTTGSTLTPGGSGSVQTNITCYNNVVFQAGSTNYADVSKTATATNCDTLYVGGQVTYAGTLRIQTNGTVAYGVGDQFKLFIVTNGCTGNFDSIVDSSGITWSFTPATGVATILTVPPTVNTNAATANFKATVASGALNFTWAQDHMGWQLYTNAVGLTATGNWFPVAGSATVTNETININPANSNVFFQLRYP
jgi:autotransporter-associated beta strand protein